MWRLKPPIVDEVAVVAGIVGEEVDGALAEDLAGEQAGQERAVRAGIVRQVWRGYLARYSLFIVSAAVRRRIDRVKDWLVFQLSYFLRHLPAS